MYGILNNKNEMEVLRESLIFLVILGINQINFLDKLATIIASIMAYFISRMLWHCFKDKILGFLNRFKL